MENYFEKEMTKNQNINDDNLVRSMEIKEISSIE